MLGAPLTDVCVHIAHDTLHMHTHCAGTSGGWRSATCSSPPCPPPSPTSWSVARHCTACSPSLDDHCRVSFCLCRSFLKICFDITTLFVFSRQYGLMTARLGYFPPTLSLDVPILSQWCVLSACVCVSRPFMAAHTTQAVKVACGGRGMA